MHIAFLYFNTTVIPQKIGKRRRDTSTGTRDMFGYLFQSFFKHLALRVHLVHLPCPIAGCARSRASSGLVGKILKAECLPRAPPRYQKIRTSNPSMWKTGHTPSDTLPGRHFQLLFYTVIRTPYKNIAQYTSLMSLCRDHVLDILFETSTSPIQGISLLQIIRSFFPFILCPHTHTHTRVQCYSICNTYRRYTYTHTTDAITRTRIRVYS